ncbi:MAG: LemA family protein [Limnochordaceae bacterium]|nr:LemA family protein [Limnochordaceae bacterium]
MYEPMDVASGARLAVTGAYPDLKANQNFLALQTSLDEFEERIQMARWYYNGTAGGSGVDLRHAPRPVDPDSGLTPMPAG